MAMYTYAQALGQERLDNPKDDLVSGLMHAEVEGERLTTSEFGSFFILLAVAGNETTRNAISWGIKLLTDNPDQRKLWMDDFDARTPDAIEEVVRWASPVIHMRRTATADTRVGDQDIAEGDKVVMWYWSANRDESVFPDGHRFDIMRPNAKAQAGYRRRRPALLPRRQPRPEGDHDDVPRDLPVAARSRGHVRAGSPAVAVHQRHQADGLPVHADVRPRRTVS